MQWDSWGMKGASCNGFDQQTDSETLVISVLEGWFEDCENVNWISLSLSLSPLIPPILQPLYIYRPTLIPPLSTPAYPSIVCTHVTHTIQRWLLPPCGGEHRYNADVEEITWLLWTMPESVMVKYICCCGLWQVKWIIANSWFLSSSKFVTRI